MMETEIQHSFKRYEKKFLLTRRQYEMLLSHLGMYMEEDIYGVHTVCNIYYDTKTYDLIRTSLEKPPYKEKFRLRSYGVPGQNDIVYAEIKKKFHGVVYKRRIAAEPMDMQQFLEGAILPEDEQIQEEIRQFLKRYQPFPRVFIGYERLAFIGKQEDLRVTFDWNIRWRRDKLDLLLGAEGMPVMPEEQIV